MDSKGQRGIGAIPIHTWRPSLMRKGSRALTRVRPDQVTLGMFVHTFDGGWLSHPFWRGRFLVNSERKLSRLRDSRVDLFIDPARGSGLPADAMPPPARRTAVTRGATTIRADLPTPVRASLPLRPIRPAGRVVAPPAFGKADKARAAVLAQRSSTVVSALFEECRIGRSLPTAQILSVVGDIANALEHNRSAFISVTRLKSKDDGTYTHSVAVCALMIGLAREAGLPDGTVQALGTAGLLHDIGKVMIDDAIIKKTDTLTPAEMAEIRRHPTLGHAILSAERGLPPVALDVCLHHHERLDGSGYPFGLRADGISEATRMAAICDVYDALTSTRPYRPGMPSVDAITHLERNSDRYDGTLLFKFMRNIAVYPAGKLVRLRSNRLAVILPSKGDERRPLARAFYATVETCPIAYEDMVLGDRLSDDQAISPEPPANWFAGDWEAMRGRILAGKPLGLDEDRRRSA